MKKIIYIVFSLIVLLTLGVFSTKAVNYNAANGTATGGTTGASFFDWNNYVNGGSDDDETWYFNGEECVKGQPLYFATSDTYNSEAECEEDNKVSPQTYTNGNNDVTTGWSDTLRGIDVYTPDVTDITRYDSDNIAVGNGFNFINGLDSFSTSELDGTTEYGLRFNNPAVLDVNGGNVTDGLSMFGTGIAHDSVITGITPLSVSGLNTSSTGYTTPSGFTGMLKGLISGIATDLGFKPTVYTLPTENNIWKFTDVGDGDNILIAPNEKTDFIFTTEEGLTDNATVTNDGTIKFVWDATKNFKDGKCRLLSPQHSSFSATPTDKPLGLTGGEEIKFHITNSNDTADTTVTMKCYTKEQVDAGLKTSTNGVQKSIKVKITKEGTGGQGSDDKDFIFQTSNKKIEETIKLEKDTAKINLELAVNQAIYSSCSTEKVNDTNWEKSTTIIETKSKEVTFDKEGKYTFTVSCVKKADKISDEKSVVITVSKEDTPSTDNEYDKWSYQEKFDYIHNDCNIEFVNTGLSASPAAVINAETKSISAEIKFNCGPQKAAKDSSGKITPGFDARPYAYGIYIDIYNKGQGVRPIKCPIVGSTNGDGSVPITKTLINNGIILDKITCNIDDSLAKEINLAKENKQVIRAVVFVDYKTNEIETVGVHNGQEHDKRRTNTTDQLGVGTGPTPPPPSGNGDKKMELEVTVNNPNGTDSRTFKDCKGGKINVKWSSAGYDNCDISSKLLTNVEGSGKTGNYDFTVSPNNTDKIVNYIITLKCKYLDGTIEKNDIKEVQINIPNCDGKKSEPPKDNIQTKCDNTKCKATYGLGKQIQLKMNGNKVLNASNFKFSVKLDGDTCDLNVFQKTFARLKLDGKIIQDITIPANTKKREFNFDNIWEQLSDKSKANIENTLATYNGAPVTFHLESWGTFDETKGESWNCNWNLEKAEVTFKKQTNGGSGEEGKDPGEGDDPTNNNSGEASGPDDDGTLLMIRNPYAADLFIYRNKQALGGASVNKTTLVYNQTGYYEIFARIPTGYTIPDSTWIKSTTNKGFMYKSFVLYSGNTINVMIQFKNLPGYPPQTETDSTLVYVSNPLGAGHFVYYTNPITKETVSLNGEKLMYGKQGMYKAEGTYKFSVVMPDKYQPPDNSWNVDSGYMTKTVTAQKGKTVYVNIIFKDNDGNTINDKGQLVITNPFTADTYIWYNDKAIGGGAKINNTTMAYQAVGKYKIKVLVPVGYTIPDSTWAQDGAYMTTTVNLKKDDVKRILVTFKNLPGYPALNFNKSLLIINNPLITGIKLYRDGIAINGGSLMYSKQMMHSIPGVYKIYAHIPYGYFAPQGWTIESGFASKTVVLPKDNIEIINVNLEFFKK